MKQRVEVEVEVVNVRLPKPVVEWLDSLVGRGIYKSRAEAIREFVRQHVLGEKEGGE